MMTDVVVDEQHDVVVATTELRRIAAVDPARPALLVGNIALTYAELDSRVDLLAAELLRRLGEGEHAVAVRYRSVERFMVAALAVQRAGKVLVCVDAAAPLERLTLITDDVEAKVLLSDVAGDEAQPIFLPEPVWSPELSPPPVETSPSRVSSIAFTSGSTGTPKGLMGTLRRRSAMTTAVFAPGSLRPGTRYAAIWAGSVGWAELNVHWVLSHGVTFVPYDINDGLAGLAKWLRDGRIELLALVPTLLRHGFGYVPEDLQLPELQKVILGGETSTWADARLVYRHLGPSATVYNVLGSTEVLISRFTVPRDSDEEGPLPAGLLVPGVHVTIVGDDGEPVPAGEPGEIVVESRDASLGYWRRPELTKSIFEHLDDGVIRVRTGDGGRWRPDGMLEHLGRVDHVVKIAGNRVELGEIEVRLRDIDGVADAAATTYVDDVGDLRLVAYVTPSHGRLLDAAAVRAELARHVPRPLVPDRVNVISELPRLNSGKVDRGVLPVLPRQAGPLEEDDTQGLERRLLAIWRDVLSSPSLLATDDFFDSGGDSVRAGRMVAEVERRLGLRIPVPTVLEARTVSALAEAIRSGADLWDPIVPLRTAGSRPPLFAVHDGGGDVYFAVRLVDELGADQPVYAVQPPSPDEAVLAGYRLEDLAKLYAAAVQRTCPHGPIALYGFSFGGLVSYEMARQLTAAGREVCLLGLGDTPAPSRLEQRGRARTQRLKELPRHQVLERAWQLVSYRTTSFVHRRRVSAAMRSQQPTDHIEAGYVLMSCFTDAAADYRPAGRYAGRTLFVHATAAHAHYHREWPAHVSGEFAVADIDGASHIDLAGTRSAEVAHALRLAIDESAVTA